MDLQLKNQHAVIVGGAHGGSGMAIGQAFVAEGAKVSLIDLLPEVADVAKPLGGTGCSADVADEQADDAMPRTRSSPVRWSGRARRVRRRDWVGAFRLSVLERPAGCLGQSAGHQPDRRRPYRSCLRSERMAEAKRGTLLFISSVAGQIGSQTDPPYSASKAGVINFAQCIAKDLAPYGVRANTLCPGMIQTTLNKGVWQSWADRRTARHVAELRGLDRQQNQAGGAAESLANS